MGQPLPTALLGAHIFRELTLAQHHLEARDMWQVKTVIASELLDRSHARLVDVDAHMVLSSP